LKLLKGVRPGRDSGGRQVTPPPAFRRIAPKPPSWLGREAAAEWRRVVPELQRLDLTKEGDRGSLTLMCEAWETFVTATRAIRDGDGLVQELSNGRKLANPLVAIAREASREYRSWAVHFGLTPSAEQALGHAAPDDDPDNPFA
jgi:P27 family predicted phage terminase small subunit